MPTSRWTELNLFDKLRRDAADHHIVRHVLRHYGTGGDDGILADGDTRTDDGADA